MAPLDAIVRGGEVNPCGEGFSALGENGATNETRPDAPVREKQIGKMSGVGEGGVDFMLYCVVLEC